MAAKKKSSKKEDRIIKIPIKFTLDTTVEYNVDEAFQYYDMEEFIMETIDELVKVEIEKHMKTGQGKKVVSEVAASLDIEAEIRRVARERLIEAAMKR